MSTKVLLLLFFVYYSNENQILNKNCGKQSAKKYIIGGKEVSKGEFPFMASISIREHAIHTCGATLITTRYALTAAHCLLNDKRIEGRRNLSLLMGTNSLTDRPHPSLWNPNAPQTPDQTLFAIDQLIVPECYGKRGLEFDIALIRLKQEIQLNERIQTICLPPKKSNPIAKERIFLAGWGKTGYEEGKDAKQPILQRTETKVYPEEFCRYDFYFSVLGVAQSYDITGDVLCFESEESTACKGDSGGPAFQLVNDKWYQIGIASFVSITFFGKCYESAPNVYTKTSSYIDWMEKTIEKQKNRNDYYIKTEC